LHRPCNTARGRSVLSPPLAVRLVAGLLLRCTTTPTECIDGIGRVGCGLQACAGSTRRHRCGSLVASGCSYSPRSNENKVLATAGFGKHQLVLVVVVLLAGHNLHVKVLFAFHLLLYSGVYILLLHFKITPPISLERSQYLLVVLLIVVVLLPLVLLLACSIQSFGGTDEIARIYFGVLLYYFSSRKKWWQPSASGPQGTMKTKRTNRIYRGTSTLPSAWIVNLA